MKTEKKKGSSPSFEKWELEMIVKKTKRLSGQYGLFPEDVKDVQQDLMLHLFGSRKKMQEMRSQIKNQQKYVSRLLDNRIRNILDAEKSNKRKIRRLTVSLDQLVPDKTGDKLITLADILTDIHAGDDPRGEDKSRSLESVLKRLNKTQQKACLLFMRGHSTVDVARIMGIKRTTLNREKNRIRKVFYQEGLEDI